MFKRKQQPPQEQPLYETSLAGFWIKVYSNRVAFNAKVVGQQSIPLDQIASVQLAMMGVWEIVLESTGGTRYIIPTNKKQEVQRAIYEAQAAARVLPVTAQATSGADEIAKLYQLMQQGVITQQEFEQKKKQILGL